MKAAFLFLFGIWTHMIWSQTISPVTISPSGEFSDQFSVSVQWTLGELAIDQILMNDVQLDEGFHQLFGEDVNTVVTDLILEVAVRIFPNPASEFLQIAVEDPKEYQFRLIDIKGQYKMSGAIRGSRYLNISDLSPALYFIELQDDLGKKGIYHFIKQ